jgi:hypothetical protein
VSELDLSWSEVYRGLRRTVLEVSTTIVYATKSKDCPCYGKIKGKIVPDDKSAINLAC